MTSPVVELSPRQRWLSELSCSDPTELDRLSEPLVERLASDAVELRKAELGLTMVAGRVGGTGEPFGLGELTVTRCVMEVAGQIGVGYVRGRHRDHARRVAVIDALLQGANHDEVLHAVIAPLSQARRARAATRAAQAEATRVQFLTMVRGN